MLFIQGLESQVGIVHDSSNENKRDGKVFIKGPCCVQLSGWGL